MNDLRLVQVRWKPGACASEGGGACASFVVSRIVCHRVHSQKTAAARDAALNLNAFMMFAFKLRTASRTFLFSTRPQTWSWQQAHAAHVRCSNSCLGLAHTERTQRSCKETRLTLHEHHLGSSRWLAFAQRLFAPNRGKNDAKKSGAFNPE